MKKPTAIIGVGNLLMGDEGVGIHAIKFLKESEWPEDVELIDAGVPGPSLLYMLEETELSIIIDCADFGGKPGDILVVEPEKLKKPNEEVFSLHGTSLLGTIALAEKLDINIGNVALICIQPKSIEMTDKLSLEVESSLQDIKKNIVNLVMKKIVKP